MSSEQLKNLRPLFSVLVVIVTLLSLVFVKMEIRRLGYSILKLSRDKRVAMAEYRQEQIVFARMTRPDRIERYAQTHLDLKRAERKQVIQITGPDIVLKD